MIRHDEIREEILTHALDLGLPMRREVSLDGWPIGRTNGTSHGRIDLLLDYPRTGIEIKVDSAITQDIERQLHKYRVLLGTDTPLWLVAETRPAADYGWYLNTGVRVSSVAGFKARLSRLAKVDTPLWRDLEPSGDAA